MQKDAAEIIDLASESATDSGYDNHAIAQVNDHAIRISVMTEAYPWHRHPNSDETFLAVEGGLFIDLDDRTIELQPGKMFTVPRGVRHRTRPLGPRSVNLTFEHAETLSETLSAPD